MKRILLSLLILGSALPASAGSWGSTQWVMAQPALLGAALSSLSSDRCQTYIEAIGVERTPDSAKDCSTLGDDFADILDLDTVTVDDKSFSIVFKSDLRRLLEDERFPVVIRFLHQTLDDVLRGKEQLFLFETVRHFMRSDAETTEWIAVLLQDVTKRRAHIAWAKTQKLSPQAEENVDKLETFIRSFWDLLDAKNSRASMIRLYPNDMDQLLKVRRNGKFYHFYVPAYITQRAHRAGYSKALSAFAGYHFNFAYEAVGQGDTVTLAWEDPQSIKSRDSAQDIYLGLLGTASAFNLHLPMTPEKDFLEQIRKDSPFSNRSYAALLGWWFNWSSGF